MIIPQIVKTYQGQKVLDFPETEIRDGSIVAILGANGSGKSTLGKILGGVIPADNGKAALLSGRVGYMSQHALGFRLSVKNNLLLNRDPQLSKKESSARAEELMKKLEIEDIAKKNAAKLSGGQTQRMSLARAFMKNYDLLILDEPTASLDKETLPLAESLIKDYQERYGITVILITHSEDQAKRLAEKIIRLEDGVPVSIE